MDRADGRAVVGLAFAGLACAGALAALACGGPTEERPAASGAESGAPAAPTAGPAPSADQPSGAAPKAGLPEWSGKLPTDFPRDVPVFPGAKVARARGTEGLGLDVSFVTGESVGKVVSFYADALAAQGWSTDAHESPEGRTVFANKEGRLAVVLVKQGAEGTEVEIMVGRTE